MFDRLWLLERGSQTPQALLHTNKGARMEAKHRVVQFTLKSSSIWLWSRWLGFFSGFVFYSLVEFILKHC